MLAKMQIIHMVNCCW